MFSAAKRSWTRAFGWRPHYAMDLPGPQDVRVATLLPVQRTRAGLWAAVGRRQLAWLDSVFRGYDGWKVVQVEIPPSPASRVLHSSGLALADGAALWAKARELGVHVIFSAEVHVLSAMQQPGFADRPGPVVVTNGGAMHNGANAHFVVVDVSEDTMELTGQTIPCRADGIRRLWQTTLRNPLAAITCGTSRAVNGRLELDRGGVVATSDGTLALPSHEPFPPVGLPWQEPM
jgi:hypothetical protein